MSGSSYLVAVENVSGLQKREPCRIFFDLPAGRKPVHIDAVWKSGGRGAEDEVTPKS